MKTHTRVRTHTHTHTHTHTQTHTISRSVKIIYSVYSSSTRPCFYHSTHNICGVNIFIDLFSVY